MSEGTQVASATTMGNTATETPAVQQNQQNLQVEETSQTQDHAKKVPQEPEYYELKVNGAVKRYTKEQLLAKASLGEAANERFEQAARLRQQYEAEQKEMAQDFIKVLEKRGLSKEQIRTRMEQWYHENFIEPEMLTEEQRKTRELERRLKQYEEEKARQEQEFKLKEEQVVQQHAAKEVQTQIIQAMEKSGLPKTRETARKIAYWMRHNLQYGFDAPMEVIIQQVKDSDRETLQTQIKDAPIEYILELFGDDLTNKLRQYDVAKHQQKFQQPGVDKSQPTKTRVKRDEPKTMRDVDRYFAELRRTKS